MFHQPLVPLGNLTITVLVSFVPLLILLFLLAGLRMTAWLACLFAGIVTILIAIFVWHAPFVPTLHAYL